MASRRVLVTGASGLLGTWLRRTARPSDELVALVHRTDVPGPSVAADLRVGPLVEAAFEASRPDIVIHAAYAQDEGSIVAATEHVCTATDRCAAELLYVSTDAVFAGDGRPRAEETRPDPIADYGRWKATAEGRVLASGGAVIRLPLLVSSDPPDQTRQRLRDAPPTVWFTDEYRRPAYADEVAAAIWRIADLSVQERAGCWHLAGAERMSRYELAVRLAGQAGGAVPVAGTTPSGVTRPRDLELTDERARRTVGWDPTPIRGPAARTRNTPLV